MEIETYIFKHKSITCCANCPFYKLDQFNFDEFCFILKKLIYDIDLKKECPLKKINIRSINDNKVEALIL